MKKVGAALAVVFCALWLAALPAGAQYVTPPGSGPTVGNTDTGSRTSERPRASRSTSADDGVEVLGVQFVRGEDGQIRAEFAVTGTDAAQLAGIGLGLVALGVVLRRRSRRAALAVA